MPTQPLMPKGTAVWLVENTALSFDQIANFCKLHPLEVKAIADDEDALCALVIGNGLHLERMELAEIGDLIE